MVGKASMQVGTDLNPMQIELMAEDLIDAYKYDSLEDIAEALKKGRQGRYGKVYGKLNGIVLAEWMGNHLEEKAIAREKSHKQNSEKSNNEIAFNEEFKKRMAKVIQEEDEKKINEIIAQSDEIIRKINKERDETKKI